MKEENSLTHERNVSITLTPHEYEVLCHYVYMDLIENIKNGCEYNSMPLASIKSKLERVCFNFEIKEILKNDCIQSVISGGKYDNNLA